MYSVAGLDPGQLPGGATSPRIAALVAALVELIAATDEVADAVGRHDRTALEEANSRSDSLVTAVASATKALDDTDRFDLRMSEVPGLCDRLRVATRRNAYLIESAWAIDAAEIRLLAGLGRVAADGGLKEYATPASPAYVDRQA